MTHREIADILGISKSRVEQIEKSALSKIRKWWDWDEETLVHKVHKKTPKENR